MSAQLEGGAVEIRCPDTNQVIPPSNYNTSTDIALSPFTGKVFDLSDLREIHEQESEDQVLLGRPAEGVDVHRTKERLVINVSARSVGQSITLLIAASMWVGFSVILTTHPIPQGSGNLFAVAVHSIFGICVAIGGVSYIFGVNELVLDKESLDVRHGLRFFQRHKYLEREWIRGVFVGMMSKGDSDREPSYCLCIKADSVTRIFSGVSKPRLDYVVAILRAELDLYRMQPRSRTGDLALSLRCPDTQSRIPDDQYDVGADSIQSPYTGKVFRLSRLFKWQQGFDADTAITRRVPDPIRVTCEQDQITLRINNADLINPYTIWVLAAAWNAALVFAITTSTTTGPSVRGGGAPGFLMIIAVVIGLILFWKSYSRTFGTLAVTLREDQCSIENSNGITKSKKRFDGEKINSIVVQGWRDMSYEKLTPSGGYLVVNVISVYGDFFFAKTRDIAVADYIAAMMRLSLSPMNRLDELQDDLPLG